LPNPFADASEIAVSGPDCGRIDLAAGFARYGEDVQRVRGSNGEVEEVWFGGMRIAREAVVAAELEQRYG
jgi:D-alanyl-D-alanine carboxypeptidase